MFNFYIKPFSLFPKHLIFRICFIFIFSSSANQHKSEEKEANKMQLATFSLIHLQYIFRNDKKEIKIILRNIGGTQYKNHG